MRNRRGGVSIGVAASLITASSLVGLSTDFDPFASKVYVIVAGPDSSEQLRFRAATTANVFDSVEGVVASWPAAELDMAAELTLDAPAPTPEPGAAEPGAPTIVDVPEWSDFLSTPEPLPANPYAPTPDVDIGRIRIPALGVDEPLKQGMTLTAINRGPSHWPGTALPGQLGNAVIAGHRTTYSKPFRDLDQLQAGDDVFYEMADGTYRYQISHVEIVEPTAVHIADQTPAYEATLFACHPPGSAAFRIVAKMRLVDGDGNLVPVPELKLSS